MPVTNIESPNKRKRIAAILSGQHVASDSQPKIQRAPREGKRVAVSYAQQRLWFLDQLEPGSAAYNIPLAVRLRGELEVEALRRALEEIGRRHEVLRTRFEVEGGEPVQVIEEGAGIVVEVEELKGES